MPPPQQDGRRARQALTRSPPPARRREHTTAELPAWSLVWRARRALARRGERGVVDVVEQRRLVGRNVRAELLGAVTAALDEGLNVLRRREPERDDLRCERVRIGRV